MVIFEEYLNAVELGVDHSEFGIQNSELGEGVSVQCSVVNKKVAVCSCSGQWG